MPYLTAPEVRTTKQRTYRYFVELASIKLDYWGIPESTTMVDVVVLEPTKEAIELLIAASGWLSGYRVISHWVPSDCAEF